MFKLSPGGTETVLYSFCSQPNCSDGYDPRGGLIADNNGNLYGTALGGNGGLVFKLAPNGTETVLYNFCSQPNCSDGFNPPAGLIANRSGNLYGTTLAVGASGVCPPGCGVVFKLAGTGFVAPCVDFAAFDGKLAVYLDPNPNNDAFGLLASFTLGSTSNGIDPPRSP